MLALTDDSKLLHATIQTGSNMDVEWFAIYVVYMSILQYPSFDVVVAVV
jgi:hypothetical protein